MRHVGTAAAMLEVMWRLPAALLSQLGPDYTLPIKIVLLLTPCMPPYTLTATGELARHGLMSCCRVVLMATFGMQG